MTVYTIIYHWCGTRYLLSLSELQMMVGRVRDNWKVSYHKGTSLLHVVDKFSISLQFDRYVVDCGRLSSCMFVTFVIVFYLLFIDSL